MVAGECSQKFVIFHEARKDCWAFKKGFREFQILSYSTSICLISTSSSLENSSEISSGVRGLGSQSSACTISKLISVVGAGLAAANGDGGTFTIARTTQHQAIVQREGKREKESS